MRIDVSWFKLGQKVIWPAAALLLLDRHGSLN
jgi:hypothetical protein